MSDRAGTASQWLSAAPVAFFSGALALGLILHLAAPASAAARVTLDAGIVLLIASPAMRIGIAVAEHVRRRDWTFVLMAAAIVVELLFVLWRAASRV